MGAVLPDLKAIVVEPERRLQGIGERLVDAGCEIVRAQGGEALFLGCRPGDRGAEDFLEATGFMYHSSVWDLHLEAGIPVAEPVLPQGYRARPFRRGTTSRPGSPRSMSRSRATRRRSASTPRRTPSGSRRRAP